MSVQKKAILKEQYLNYIEEELMGGKGGGRWIASFNVSIRGFNLVRALKKAEIKHKNDFDLVVYGGVRQSGFLLSKFFAYTASPSYRVGCAVVGLKQPTDVKWSSMTRWIRDATNLMEALEFEWLWLLFFGKKMIPKSVQSKIERFAQRELALIYADIQNRAIIHSDSFIARRGGTLFHPKNLDREGFRLRFWRQ